MTLDNIEVTSSSDRALAAWEIASIVCSCLIAEWAVTAFSGTGSLIGVIPIVLALALMIFSHKQRGESPRDIGFRIDNFLPAAKLLLIPTIIAIGLILLGCWWANDHSLVVRPFRARLLIVPLWALFQQYGLQGFLNRRAQMVFGPGATSILVVALLFALVHMPSPLLVSLGFVGGMIWGYVYQRQPNLFAIALSHSLASLSLSLTMPEDLVRNLRIGFKYFGTVVGLRL